MLDSKALTKIQSIILIAIVVVAAVAGIIAYMLWSGPEQSSETIKIGFLADLDTTLGMHQKQGALMAVEELNSEGGLLGRQIELISEDSDIITSRDGTKVSMALTRLITYNKVDFIVGGVGEFGLTVQEIVSEHKKIFLSFAGSNDAYTQRVIDDYDKYKYFFRVGFNDTASQIPSIESRLSIMERTGFTKIGYLAEDSAWNKGIRDGLENVLGDDLVYKGVIPLRTVDFSSYFAAAEAAGTEILMPLITSDAGISFVKEYYDRQSPMIIYGGVLSMVNSRGWEWTDGKCEYITVHSNPVSAGYPLTSKTLATREAYVQKWGELPTDGAVFTYDIIRFILADAIERAGTIETEAVINALEETRIEISLANNFVFTPSHDTMYGVNLEAPKSDYMITIYFQWINGERVPVYPKKIMEEAGATYTFPDWSGPWDNIS